MQLTTNNLMPFEEFYATDVCLDLIDIINKPNKVLLEILISVIYYLVINPYAHSSKLTAVIYNNMAINGS
jgi:hypothetical protein